MPRKSWWARLPFGVRMAAGGSALLFVISSAVAGVAALTKDGPDAPRIITAVGQEAAPGPEAPAAPIPADPGYNPAATLPRTSDQADRTATRAPRRPAGDAGDTPAPAGAGVSTQRRAATMPEPARATAAAKAAAPPVTLDSDPRPVLTTRIETETREIPFQTRLVRDPALPRGAKQIRTAGVPGVETLRYLVTFTDGKQTDRRLLDSAVTRQPQHRVVAFGARRGKPDHRHPRRGCGKAIDFCVPLSRSAPCPREESAVHLGGSVTVLDQDIELIDAETLGDLSQVNCTRK